MRTEGNDEESVRATPSSMSSDAGAFVDYWKLRMEGATHRLKAAKTIISHTGTRGSLAENLLRELIAEFLPHRWGVGSGFLLSEQKQVSRQVDILVYDLLTSSPIYRDGDVVALTPGTAKLAIEVKSDLDGDGLVKAMENMNSVKQIDGKVYGMIFGYDGVQPATLRKHVTDWFATPEGASAKVKRRIPNRMYNMSQRFLAIDEDPERIDGDPASGGDVSEIDYWLFEARVPVTHYFLTEVLSRLEMHNLNAFLPAEAMGRELHRF